jgi:hypothetical protein
MTATELPGVLALPGSRAALFSSSALTGLTAIAIHPNGHTVVVGSGTSAVIGEVDPETVARRICATSGSPLTPREWSHYFQNLPYREYCP